MKLFTPAKLVLLSASLLLITSCQSDDEEFITRRLPATDTVWTTVVAYMIAENNLIGNIRSDLEDMAEGYRKAPEGTNWLVYMDDGPSPRLYRLYKKGDGTVAESLIRTYENQYSTDPAVMNRILQEAYSLYPADSLGLILSSHASGSLYSSHSYKESMEGIFYSSRPFAFGEEAAITGSSASFFTMNVSDLREALEGLPRLQYILFDACLMGNVESLYELKDHAHYAIASPNSTPGGGYPYDKILPDLAKMGMYDLTHAASQFVTTYATDGSTWNDFASSAVYDLSRMQDFAHSFSQMLEEEESIERLNALDRTKMQLYETYWPNDTEYPDHPLYDIGLLIDSIAPAETAAALHGELRKLIVQYAHLDYLSVSYDGNQMLLPYDASRVCGLTVYIPPTLPYKESSYREYNATLSWTQDCGLLRSARYNP